MKAGIIWRLVAAALLCSAVVWAQQSAQPAPASNPAAVSAPAGKRAPAAPESSQSRPSRRDPFHTLIAAKKPDGAPVRLPPGKKGLVIGQLELLGFARAVDGSWIAVVDTKAKRAYFLHEKDQLYNGTVSKITADRVVFLENLNTQVDKRGTREVVMRMSPE